MASPANSRLDLRRPLAGAADQFAPLDGPTTALARQCEQHEAAAWAACAEACAQDRRHRLHAVVDRGSPLPLYALAQVDLAAFNRVVGLGTDRAATRADVARLLRFYQGLGQSEFRVELAPVSEPADLARWLEAVGFRRTPLRMAKLFRPASEPVEPVTGLADGVEVRAVSADEADAVALVNRKAWGLPRALSAWYAASVGRPGFVHHGVFEQGQLVAVGAMYLSDGLAWLGFDATMPDHRGRGYQTVLQLSRLAEVAERGCEHAHADIEAGTTSLRNAVARGFRYLYDRAVFASPERGVSSR
jgi:hypothetical protein